jgi:alkane 1-monooxygenase
MTVLTYGLDMLVRFARDPENPEAEFPAANRLSVILACAHLALLPLIIYALSHDALTVWQKIWLFMAAGLFCGQVSNSNAHELTHRTNRMLRRLGTWVYISVLFGHHASAHPKVHHRFVATDMDPNSAPKGMSYYQFFPRAWIGSFKAGYKAETTQRTQSKKRGMHPYVTYIAGALLCVAFAAWIGGAMGVLVYLLVSVYASAQLMLSDYVQHYGLRRKPLAQGGFEPVGILHSWNSPHWFSSYLMLNAPRHSDHHAHPMTPYVALELPPEAPCLPRSLPAMATLALFPRLWRRVMDKRVDRVMLHNASTQNPAPKTDEINPL